MSKSISNSITGAAVLLACKPEVLQALLKGKEGIDALQARISELESAVLFQQERLKEICNILKETTSKYD